MTWQCAACGAENPTGTRFCGQCGTSTIAPNPGTSASEGRAAEQRLPEQRRLVTALFADLSGFTRLSEQLDEEALSELVDDVVTSMSAVIDRFGGSVLNYAGDAILAGFGIPVASGDDAERALAAALAIRDELQTWGSRNSGVSSELGIHIGVNTGHAVARYSGVVGHVAYTVVGDSVNIAQRLQTAAPTGEIYVGGSTVELAGHRFVVERVGQVELKGKLNSVEAWRLVRRRDDVLHERTRELIAAKVIGRTDVIADLRHAATESLVVTVAGEAGIGKTTAVLEGLRHLKAGETWAAASAAPYQTVPYSIWRPIVRSLFGTEALFAPADVGTAPSVDADDIALQRTQMHARAIAALVGRSPVVIVLDDLQWADPASLDFARDLATALTERTSRVHPVGLVLTVRPEGVSVAESITGLFPAERRRTHHLSALSTAETSDLAEALLGRPADPSLVAMISDRTGGSPFFTTELVRLMRDRGELSEADNGTFVLGAGATSTIPPTVEELVNGRLDALDLSVRNTLELIAAAGSGIRRDVLAVAYPGRADATTLAPAIDAGLLVTDADRNRLEFRHGIVRDVAYQRTLRVHRQQLHASVANALRTLSPVSDDAQAEIAYHLYCADAGGEAVEALTLAAQHATLVFANESAIDLLNKAMELADRHQLNPTLRRELGLRRAQLNTLVGRAESALDEFRELQHVAEPAIAEAAGFGAARALRFLGRYDLAIDTLDAMRLTSPAGEVQRRGIRASALVGAGRLHEAVDECDIALAGEPNANDRLSLLLERAQAYDGLGRSTEALADAEAANRLAGTRETAMSVKALRVLGGLYVDVERFDEAERTLRRGEERARAGGVTLELVGCLVSLSFLAQRRGQLNEAIALDRQSVAELHRLGHGFEAGALANLAHKLVDAGEPVEAREVADRALAAAIRIGDDYAMADANFAIGRTLGLQHEWAAAQAALTESLRILHGIGTTSMVGEINALLAEWSTA